MNLDQLRRQILSDQGRRAAESRWKPARQTKERWVNDALAALQRRVEHGDRPKWKHSDYLADMRRSIPPYCYQERPSYWEALRRAFIKLLNEMGRPDVIKRN